MRQFLIYFRYFLLLPVIACIVLTIGVTILGFNKTFSLIIKLSNLESYTMSMAKKYAVEVIEIIDMFLVGVVSYISAVGIFKLFVLGREMVFPIKLKIDNLRDLESKIIGVVIAALSITFLGKITGGYSPEIVLYYGGGIALVIVALTFFIKQK